MASAKDVRDKLIEILQAADPKNASGTSVQEWFGGAPPRSRWPGFPFGWVEWIGGPVSPSTMSARQVVDNFHVVLVDRYPDETEAENSILDFSSSVEAALEADPKIGELVGMSYVTNREKLRRFEDDYSAVAVIIEFYTRRKE